MAFSLTSKNVELRGSWLVAVVRKPDGSWNVSKLDLNEHIGNRNGEFDVAMDRWYNSAENWSCHLRGPILCAQLRTITGACSPERCINLDLFVKNHDGSLEFQDLTDSLLLYAGCLTLEDSSRLRGLVVGRDGKFAASEIDLGQHYGNINGRFEAGERHYGRTGRNFRLDQDSGAVRLLGELMDCEGAWHDAEVDLAECIVNQNGKLAFVKHEDGFVRQDWQPAIAEQMPVLGEAITGLNLGDDKEDHIYYEIASNTNSTESTVGIAIGTFIGRAVRNPAMGMVIGAHLTASPDAFVDEKTAGAIEDGEARSRMQEATLGRHVCEAIRDMFADDAAAAAAAEILDASLTPQIDIWANGVVAWFEKQELPATVLSDLSLYAMMKKVIRQLRGEPVECWAKAQQQLDGIKASARTLKLTPPPKPPTPEPEPEVPLETPEAPAAGALEGAKAKAEGEGEGEQLPQIPELLISGPETSELPAAAAAAQTAPEAGQDAQSQKSQAPAGAPNQDQDPKVPAAGAGAGATSSGTASTRQSSSDDGSAGKAKGGDGKGSDRASSVRGNCNAATKGWHGLFGITTFRRSWARSKQPKVVTTT
ncbi:CNVH-domain-containing protein [Hypoxylon sp. FL1284]|nr:CNVH-domain-containing protein [Hypoxylon sp. FL1284]